ncbi:MULTISPECIES: tryptophan synthase subunit alpha [Achromobacter]|jgi:tryptophan synthase alpha chain|uniref:Tryptophan synthase alpha chain n=1 Tax=Achromobacter denitrificans TaxID=32002 RepID=A0A427WVB7_ACHDE|nr:MULTISPECIES: tryptophan synthase subunit alpha [Achromobacter]ASC63321.1 tryptophan synthase subunit alpha [Achromobacter denitrificans]MDF3850821.1 tryptophan synthase subunit alpha [Achromobacter denitrificans]MDF3862375.1 tryptophan synthase subunit alpha [Achromobacter denitrificans]MDF3943732.1 tryptophan synthase subunit alpha [Achromobacter denitrificans]OLU09674.1 tryptophan synthase subunit alpha [Achromobacter denitrificans]
MATRTDRIAAAFARTAESGRAAALIPYIAAGDPTPATTVPLMHALVEAGADVIELGVPFSDPMADGPVIQRAADRAIAQGVGLSRVLAMVAEFRQRDADTPVVLMGYANPIERMGQDRFALDAAQAGVDGVLVVDYPPEEVVEFAAKLGEQGIAPIFLLAPTSTEARIKAVAAVARGYVYYVSLKGVTGSGSLNTDDVAERVAVIRRHVRDIPVGVGFGIRDAESAQRVARAADAVVIGSKLIETMEQAVADVPAAQKTDAAVAAASGWLRTIRQALDLVKRENASA